MNIKKIVDKIIKEADIQAQDYTVADRLDDVNAEYLLRVEKGVQIASTEPMSRGEATSEVFTIVDGSNTFTRTIKDAPIQRLDYLPTGGSYYTPMDEDQKRRVNTWNCGDQRVFANEKQMFVENGRAGTLRVTYARGAVILFTQADYENVSPPSPDFLPEVFHPLLWLKPAWVQASYYKKDRATALAEQYKQLSELFDNHYGRNSTYNGEVITDEEDGGCFGGSVSRR